MRFKGRKPTPSEELPQPQSVEVILHDPMVRASYVMLAEHIGWPVEAVARVLDLQRCLGVSAELATGQLIAGAAFGHRPETMVELLATIYATVSAGEMSESGGVISLSTGQNFYYDVGTGPDGNAPSS